MQVRDVMTTAVFTLEPEYNINMAKDMMQWRHVRHIPVVNAHQELVGLVSHRDLLRATISSLSHLPESGSRKLDNEVLVNDIMSAELHTISSTADLKSAAQKMRDKQIGCLLVTQGKKLQGIVTEADFLPLAAELELVLSSSGARSGGSPQRTVGDWMSRKVTTLQADDPLDLAQDFLEWKFIRHIPVLDRTGKLVGILTHRDLLKASESTRDWVSRQEQQRIFTAFKVRELMHTDVKTVTPQTPLREAAWLLMQNKIGCLPVLENDKLVGIISEADFLKLAWEQVA